MSINYSRRRARELSSVVNQGGIDALSGGDRIGLASFYVREVVAGKFLVGATDACTLSEFIVHLQVGVAKNPEYDVPIYYRRDLRIDAGIIRDQHHPVGALILYATWFEHWLNGVIFTAATRRGKTPESVRELLRNTGFKKKLSVTLADMGLPPLDADVHDAVLELVNLRHDYLHFKYTGQEAQTLNALDARLTTAVSRAEPLLDELKAYSITNFFEPAVTDASRLFRLDRRDIEELVE
jgi:hypothetical protein